MPSRRQLLQGLGAAGTVGLLGFLPEPVGAEPPPETKRVRLTNRPVLCEAPNYVAEELLQGEGSRTSSTSSGPSGPLRMRSRPAMLTSPCSSVRR